MKVMKVLGFIFGILVIVCGICCLFSPAMASLNIGYAIGLSMIIDAIGRFAEWGQEKRAGDSDGWMLVGAILSIVLGFFILNSVALQLSLDVFIYYYVSIWFVVHGIIAIIRAAKIRRLHKNWDTKMLGTHWYLPLIIGILNCVFGVLCVIKPIRAATFIGIFIGLGIITMGANMISAALTPAE